MGCECVLEPTVAAYHLDYKAASGSGNKYVGTNFALPHRDYTYRRSSRPPSPNCLKHVLEQRGFRQAPTT